VVHRNPSASEVETGRVNPRCVGLVWCRQGRNAALAVGSQHASILETVEATWSPRTYRKVGSLQGRGPRIDTLVVPA